MGKRLQKWLCLLLVLCVAVSMLPVIAAAEMSTDVIIEAEDCTQTTSGQWAEHSRQKGSSSSAEHGKFSFVQTEVSTGQSISFTLAPAAGTYELYVTSKDNPDRAIFQFSLNGANIGEPVDQYNATTSGVFVEHKIGTVMFSGEAMQLTATLTGRNAANTTYYGGTFDYFRLVPVSGGSQEPANKVLYAENFDEAMPNGLGDGWARVKLKSGYALQGTSAAGAGLLAALPSGELPEEYTIVADMALMQARSSSGYSAGVTFQHKDAKNFYHFRLDNGAGIHAQLYQWADGTCNKQIVSESGYLTTETDGEARRLRVTVSVGEINCYIDGQLVANYANGAAGGTVGLRVYNAVALFDNVTVYSGVVGPEENERANPFEFEEAATVWNNEDETYQESTGTWSSVTGAGWNGSGARTAENGSAGWSSYPPETGNFKLEYDLPAADCAAINVTVQTLNGTWKYTIPAGTAAGWNLLGVVSATAGTAFTLTVESAGRIYADAVRLTVTEQTADAVYTPTDGGSEKAAILVNQIGYDNGTAMRASCPNVADGTEFQVVNAETKAVVKTGTVEKGIADFTGLETQTDTDFYLTCVGKQSYTFTVGTNLIQRRSVKQALAFMSEVRSDTFCVGQNSIAWRDSHQFSFELNGLVLQYMANPSAYDNMPYGIVETATCEYPELREQNEPDIIWLIKFAARRYYDWGCTEGKKLHMLTKEQLAYYLYLAPELIAHGWETEEFYQKVRDYTISVWGENACNVQWYAVQNTNHDLYSVQTIFGGLKGAQPMGHSIVPNLMMYEVAKRDGLGDETANAFLKAAVDNCAYTVSNEDGNDICDPFFCKGQRMSEYITVPALGYFIEMCPGEEILKAQVKAKIAEWAKVNIARGDNLWDIRMAVSEKAGDLTKYQFHNPNFTDKTIKQEYWTGAAYANADQQASYLSGGAPKNEPGNQAGLQAVMYAAARVLDDNTVNTRLHELGVAAIDDLYGRNPSGRAAFYHFTRDFTGADFGWYKQYQGGAGVLGGCTAVIDANAPEGCYPFNPAAYASGYTEGWVAYNTAWNVSLAYSQAENVTLSVDKTSGKVGNTVSVTLTAPIDMDTAAVESGTVQVTNNTTGERTTVTVTEDSVSSTTFKGSLTLPNAQTVTVSYGSGLFAHGETITVEDYQEVKTTATHLSAAKTEAKDPSCTENGNIEYWFCADCGRYFRDEACTQEIKQQDTILTKLGHDKMVHHPAVAATTTKKGSREYWECSRCSKWFWDAAGTKEIVDHSDVKIPKKSSGGTSMCPAVKPTTPTVRKFLFTDVPSDSWYYGSVKMDWEKKLIDGITETQFQPDGTLTVAQTIKLAAALYQMEHEGKVTLENGGANWYDIYVSYAVDSGIIEKVYQSYTMTQMNTAITRAEFVHILHGAESTYKVINQIADNAIPDVKTGDEFASEIYEFYRAGILTGSDAKGTFHATSEIKRSETSAILLRMFDESARKSITLK